MRPQSINRFEQLYLASTAVGVINLFVNYRAIAERAGPVGGGAVMIGAVIGWGIVFLFWYFISRRASNVAKWILVAMTVLGLLGMIRLLDRLAEYGTLYAVLTSLTTLLQLASIVFLFRRDAVEWLRSKGQIGAVDISTFN